MTDSLRSAFAARVRLCRRHRRHDRDGITVILLALTPDLLDALDVRRGDQTREAYIRELIVEGGFHL